MDDILSRLIEISVGPVEQVPPCACKAPRSPANSRLSCSANNAVDTNLPYNPWYGSHTEHRLQIMSIDDANQLQIISPMRIVLAKPLVHVEEEWNNGERLDQLTITEMTSMSPSDEATFIDLVERNLNVHTPSTELHTKVDSAEKDESSETASVAAATEEDSIATGQTSVPVTPEEKCASQADRSASKQNAESATSEEDKVEKTSDTGGKLSQREKLAASTEFPNDDNQKASSKPVESETVQQLEEESKNVSHDEKNFTSSGEKQQPVTHFTKTETDGTRNDGKETSAEAATKKTESSEHQNPTASSESHSLVEQQQNETEQSGEGAGKGAITSANQERSESKMSLGSATESMQSIQPLNHDPQTPKEGLNQEVEQPWKVDAAVESETAPAENNEAISKVDDVSDNQRSLEESDDGKKLDHTSTPTDTSTVEDGQAKEVRWENGRENETETKSTTAKVDHVTECPIPQPRHSLKSISIMCCKSAHSVETSSKTSEHSAELGSNLEQVDADTRSEKSSHNEETGHKATEYSDQTAGNFDQVDTDIVNGEIRPHKTKSVTWADEEEMDVDETGATPGDAETTSKRRSDEMLTSGVKKCTYCGTDVDPHQQQQQQNCIETEPECKNGQTTYSEDHRPPDTSRSHLTTGSNDLDFSLQPPAANSDQSEVHHHHQRQQPSAESTEQKPTSDGQRTVSISDRSTVVKDLDNKSLPSATNSVQSTADNTSVSSAQSATESSGHKRVSLSSMINDLDNQSLVSATDSVQSTAGNSRISSEQNDSVSSGQVCSRKTCCPVRFGRGTSMSERWGESKVGHRTVSVSDQPTAVNNLDHLTDKPAATDIVHPKADTTDISSDQNVPESPDQIGTSTSFAENTEQKSLQKGQRTVSMSDQPTAINDLGDNTILPSTLDSVPSTAANSGISSDQSGAESSDDRRVSLSTVTNNLDNQSLLSATDSVQSTAGKSGISSEQNVSVSSGQVCTSKTCCPLRLSRGASMTERRAESVPQTDSESLDKDDGPSKFPKSATGHKVSEQKDSRSRRLAKSVRVYHDLSTIIDYQEDDNKAITTIYLKSARK